MDQRRAHVLAREVAHPAGWPVPLALHTPLISSLKGGGRMDPARGTLERKMSKSDPTSSVVIPCTREELGERMRGAFCPAKEVEGNPVVEIVEHILFPYHGRLAVDRPARFGGPVEFASAEEFRAAWRSGGLHPQDLKGAVAEALWPLLAPAAEHFAAHPERLQALDEPSAVPVGKAK